MAQNLKKKNDRTLRKLLPGPQVPVTQVFCPEAITVTFLWNLSRTLYISN